MSRSQFWVRAGLLLAVAALVPACGRSRSRGGVATNVPGVVVDLTSLTSTSETGSTTSFTVALATLPSDDVVINLSSSNTSEGTVSPAQLTFTAANGTTAQTVTVTGEDDALLDGNIAYTIVIAAAVSTDANYSGVDAADVNLTNNDDEVIGITVTPTALGDLTEGGAAAQFTVALSAPAPGGATVTVPITVTAGEVTVDGPGSGGPATTFNLDLTPAQPSRVVTVAAVNDGDVEATEPFTIETGDPTSTNAEYDALTAAQVDDVTGNVLDNDNAGIVVEPVTAPGGVTLLTSELGHKDTFRVRLGSSVTGQVTVTITGVNANEGSVSPLVLVFNNANAQTFQTVTVTGLDDPVTPDTADQPYTLTLDASNTGGNPADAVYDAVVNASVHVVNVDTEGMTMPPGGTNTTAPSATPGIPLGGNGAFNEQETTDPTVIQKPGPVFEMWMRGREQSGVQLDAVGRSTSATVPPSTGWSTATSVFTTNPGFNWVRKGVGRPSVVFGNFDNVELPNPLTPDTYLLFYSGRRAGDYDGINWTPSTDDPFNPGAPHDGFWFAGVASTPAFTATGGVGDWDRQRVTDPCVIFEEGPDVFHMWYTGVDANGLEQIGYATAPLSGGVPGPWTRHNVGATPALGIGATGRFDAGGVSQPAVVLVGGTWHMWYTAFDPIRNRRTIGYASAAKASGNNFQSGRFPLPVIVPDSTGTATWSDQNVFAPAVVHDPAPVPPDAPLPLWRIWYTGTGSTGRGIGYIQGN